MASESCSSFVDSSSIACRSSDISCMSAVVCLALSHKLLHKFTEGPAVVAGQVVGLVTFFFPFPRGFITFPLSLAFLPCPSGAAFVCFATCHYDRSWQCNRSVCIVVTMACKSLYLLLYDLLRSFCLFNSAYRLFIAFTIMGVVATKLVIHFPTTGS